MSTQTKTTAPAGEVADASWFSGLGLGVFIHWGHASTRGWELSWQMTGGVTLQEPPLAPVGCDEYFVRKGHPTYVIDQVSRGRLAWRAGARYVVFTAKHHDGFAMFSTALSDYSVVKHAPFGRDATAEIVEAFRARGFRIGLYFSVIDWHHPDYPRYTDETVSKPYVGSYPTAPEKGTLPLVHARPTRRTAHRYGLIDIVWLTASSSTVRPSGVLARSASSSARDSLARWSMTGAWATVISPRPSSSCRWSLRIVRGRSA